MDKRLRAERIPLRRHSKGFEIVVFSVGIVDLDKFLLFDYRSYMRNKLLAVIGKFYALVAPFENFYSQFSFQLPDGTA